MSAERPEKVTQTRVEEVAMASERVFGFMEPRQSSNLGISQMKSKKVGLGHHEGQEGRTWEGVWLTRVIGVVDQIARGFDTEKSLRSARAS